MDGEKVLIVEDDEDIRGITSHYLEKKGYVVFQSGDGSAVLNIVNRESPDIILLDIVLPGVQGYDICAKIREFDDIPIIFLSCKRDSVDKIKGLELGADDFITKPFDLAEVEARIRANLRRTVGAERKKQQKKHMFRYDNLVIDLDSYEVFLDGEPVSLYTKELQLLLLLIENKNRVFSAEQLYDQIWGIDSFGDLKTVMVHISNLRRKIEKDPAKPKLIKTIRGFGYKFSVPNA